MTVSMGTVWDRAVDVLRGRTGILAWIASVAVFVPSVVSSAVGLFAPGASGLATIVVLVASIWGQLALLAVSTHPATTRTDAMRQASQRLLPAIGIVILIGFLFGMLLLPPVLALVQAGLPMTPEGMSAGLPAIPAGTRSFVTFYFLAIFAAALFVGARLLVLNSVILNERRGLRAIPRAFQLTRGATWRIVGVLLLYAMVLLVSVSAVQFVVTVPLRLLLGAESLPTVVFLTSIVASALTTAFSVVAAAFTAQLYVALAGDRPAA